MARSTEAERAYRERLEAGLCTRCGAERDDRQECAGCLDLHRRARARRAKNPWRGTRPHA